MQKLEMFLVALIAGAKAVSQTETYDGRAGMKADLKSDKHGLGLEVIRKYLLPAQKMVVMLVELAHHILMWARRWFAERDPAASVWHRGVDPTSLGYSGA